MAVPLDPDMPRALEAPAAELFIESDELRDLAEQVMSEYSEFRAINDAVRESELVLTYVWETKPWTDEEELEAPHDREGHEGVAAVALEDGRCLHAVAGCLCDGWDPLTTLEWAAV